MRGSAGQVEAAAEEQVDDRVTAADPNKPCQARTAAKLVSAARLTHAIAGIAQRAWRLHDSCDCHCSGAEITAGHY